MKARHVIRAGILAWVAILSWAGAVVLRAEDGAEKAAASAGRDFDANGVRDAAKSMGGMEGALGALRSIGSKGATSELDPAPPLPDTSRAKPKPRRRRHQASSKLQRKRSGPPSPPHKLKGWVKDRAEGAKELASWAVWLAPPAIGAGLGALAGSAVGGPVGAAVGGAVGGTAGAAVTGVAFIAKLVMNMFRFS